MNDNVTILSRIRGVPAQPATQESDADPSNPAGLLFHEICPYRIGSRVRINPKNKYASEWLGNYAVVGITWDYQKGDGLSINIAIASDDEISGRQGSTDGWSPDDLIPA